MKLFSILLSLLLLIPSCKSAKVVEEQSAQVGKLLEESSQDLFRQEYDVAMEKALKALDLSADNPLMQVKALSAIVGVDIMTSRDDDAWEKALKAEDIARRHGYMKDLAGILISKAKLCSYAEISPETGRNDEGLAYAGEALRIAEELGDVEQEADACYITGSLYINKNRWSNPIDNTIYRTAGEWLDRGQAIADSIGIERLRRNGVLFRSRWFQQGDRNEEALEYFAKAREALRADDHLMASALDDRLVRLYTRVGNHEKALDAHDDYVREIIRYMTQKADETIQEMETRFEVHEKDREIERRGYRISILILIVLLGAAVIILLMGYSRRVRRRNKELQRLNDTKEQIIDIISRDLRSPASGYASKLEKLAANPGMLNNEVAAYVEGAMEVRASRIADIGLSQRELQIIRLSAEGLTAAEIAARLYLSVHTVNTHRHRIYSKMEVKNVSDMLRVASELGIV